ncbi:MAG: ABC transporter permease [Patescibacteria group bacterium]|nr:ABC transporter permease [Patescibacteria group bacterium]
MEIIIKPKNKWWQLDLKEIWQFRDLFYFFTWRDLKVKYKQTLIGVLWAVFQPFITMVVFTVFFGKLVQMPSDGISYPIFVYVGLLFWTLFSTGLTNASNIFVNNEKIITKVYFPKLTLLVSSILTNVIDFFIASIILFAMMFWYHYTPNILGLLLLPVLLLMTILSTIGIGLFFSSINVKYRDVRFILPFFIQLLMFLTPVIYPVSLAPEKYRWILGLNPMSGIIDSARAVVFGTGNVDWSLFLVSMISMLVYFIMGYIYFKKTERYFADII